MFPGVSLLHESCASSLHPASVVSYECLLLPRPPGTFRPKQTQALKVSKLGQGFGSSTHLAYFGPTSQASTCGPTLDQLESCIGFL